MEEKRLKLLFLTPRFPFPLIGGDRLKPFYMMKHLAKKHDVKLVSFYQGSKPLSNEYLRQVTSLGVEAHVVNVDPLTAGLRTLVLSMFTRKPFEISFYSLPEFGFEVEKLCKKHDFDLGFAFYMRTAEFIKNKLFKKILVAEDCRTLYQNRSYLDTNDFKQRIIRKWETSRLRKYEPEIMNHFDVATFVTHEDIKAISEMNPDANYRHLTNGVNLEIFRMPGDDNVRSGILFAGKLDIWANYLMLQQIIGKIYPIVREKLPSAVLKVVGARPTKAVKSLLTEKIKTEFNVESMVPHLQKARVFIHPHSGGTGIQNKLLEAMACGCPVVTTPTGIQGIPATHGKDVLIGKNTEEMAEHIISVLENDELASSLGHNARKMIEENLSWVSIYKELDSIVDDVMKIV